MYTILYIKIFYIKDCFYIASKSNETTKYNHTITIHFPDVYRFNIILVNEYYTIYSCCKIKLYKRYVERKIFKNIYRFLSGFSNGQNMNYKGYSYNKR